MNLLAVNIVNALNDSLVNHSVVIAGDNFHLFAKHNWDKNEPSVILNHMRFNTDQEVYWTSKLDRMITYVIENLY